MKGLSDAVRDIFIGSKHYELWLHLGWHDVLSKYRRLMLGSLWIPMSMVIITGVLGFLYSGIIHKPASEYIPYLAVGFITWNLISGLVIDGSQSFVANSVAIKEISVPASVYVYRHIWKNTFVFTHNLLVYLLFVLIFDISPFPAAILALPALLLYILNGMWVGLLFGIINARFRDFSQLLNSVMRLLFFATPIIWYSESTTGLRSLFVTMNPFYYFIEIFRAPLLGSFPTAQVWFSAIAITLTGWFVTLPVFAHWRRKIPYWV
jgi:ABC-2 type transport system permease protein/lipopolysaccharide transport system permease protein